MLIRKSSKFLQKLKHDPREKEAWHALAHWFARLEETLGERALFLFSLRPYLGLGAQVLQACPEDRDLANLLLAVAGLALPKNEESSYEQGLPKRVLRGKDQAVLLKIPGILTYLDLLPVSVRQYRAFLESASLAPRPDYQWRELKRYQDRPAVFVRQEEAQAFAAWVGGSLPTRSQFRQAAFAGDLHAYPWGDAPLDENRACFNLEISDASTWHEFLPVLGQNLLGSGPGGHLDLLGGVWEWLSWEDEEEEEEYPGEAEAAGGSFRSSAYVLEQARFQRMDCEERREDLGFRIAISLASP